MKNIIKLFFLLVSVILISCSENQDDDNNIKGGDDDLQVNVNIETRSLPNDLQCNVYVFTKNNGGTDYLFKDSMKIINSPSVIKFKNQDLAENDYRFLFIATSKNNAGTFVLNKMGSSIQTNQNWNDIMIRSKDILLSNNNYYGVLNRTGQSILDEGSIDGNLTRMYGQLTVDIFKVTNNIESVVDIDTTKQLIASVLDRVYKIDIEYQGITRDVIFNSQDSIVYYMPWSGKYTQVIEPVVTDDGLKVIIPQEQKNLEASPVGKLGSVRIKGINALPSDKGMRMKLTFHYYDTTPKCEITDGSHRHDKSCFDKRSIELNLPQTTDPEKLLSVFANYYTVNKAAIRFNRIIEVGVTGGFIFDTMWANNNRW